MVTFFVVCAAGGGTIMVLQLLLMLMGIGGGEDAGDLGGDAHFDIDAAHDFDIGHADFHDVHADAEHGSSVFFGILSFRALVAAATFFGLGGLAGNAAGLSPLPSFSIGIVAGAAAMFVVAWVLRLFVSLHSQGNIYIESSIGSTGSVYLSIPSGHGGTGKVTVPVQGRLQQYQAVTAGNALPTGARVKVIGILGPDTVEVESVSS